MQIALCVPPRMRIEVMLPAVNFDNEPMPQANKVNDKIIARRLATKVKAAFAPRSKMNPKLHLLRRHLLTQTSCDFVRHRPHPAAASRRPPSPLRGEG